MCYSIAERMIVCFWLLLALPVLHGCAATSGRLMPDLAPGPGSDEPEAVYASGAGVTLGEPLAVAISFDGHVLVADGVSGRVLSFDKQAGSVIEFQRPPRSSGFYPIDVDISGFFVYVLDEVGREILRFDRDGAFRGVLVNFDQLFASDRPTPGGMDADDSGRIVASDMKNHRVVVLDSYFEIELVFGNYGSYEGQFVAPEGIAFTERGEILVTDTGNRRVQLFDASGTFIRAVPAEASNNRRVQPRRAVMAANGDIYVADPEAERIFVFDASGMLVRDIAPQGVAPFHPTDVELAHDGLIYVSDAASSALYVFR
jgi:DNA-binding beta-propeller fold protein YncE